VHTYFGYLCVSAITWSAILDLQCIKCTLSLYFNGQFHNCQSWSFITVHVNFNPIDKDYIVSWKSDLEYTKESILPVCDKPYYKIKENMPLGEELENLWNYPLQVPLLKSPFFCSLFALSDNIKLQDQGMVQRPLVHLWKVSVDDLEKKKCWF